MKKELRLLGLLLALSGGMAVAHAGPVGDFGDNVAYRLTVQALGNDVAESDARVVRTRGQLEQVAKVTGETPEAVAAACVRTSGWFFDVTRTKATSLEMLDALVKLAKAGTPMQDSMRDYVQARRQVAGHGHAEALAALAGGKK